MHFLVYDKVSNLSFFFSYNCYGYPNYDNSNLWNEISELTHGNKAWCIIGDFNEVRSLEDKMGSCWIDRKATRDFNNFITDNDLLEV